MTAKKRAIPEDVMKAADTAWLELSSLSTLGRVDETAVIARAILADRKRRPACPDCNELSKERRDGQPR